MPTDNEVKPSGVLSGQGRGRSRPAQTLPDTPGESFALVAKHPVPFYAIMANTAGKSWGITIHALSMADAASRAEATLVQIMAKAPGEGWTVSELSRTPKG